MGKAAGRLFARGGYLNSLLQQEVVVTKQMGVGWGSPCRDSVQRQHNQRLETWVGGWEGGGREVPKRPGFPP